MKVLRELEDLRRAGGSIGPDHPRFKKWQADARSQLERCGDEISLREFQRLSFNRKSGNGRPAELRDSKETQAFLQDLTKAASLLEKALPAAPATGTDHWLSDPPKRTTMPNDSDASVAGTLRTQYFASTSRIQTIDTLLARLGQEMKSESGDWDAIQEVMEEMAALKRSDELLHRLESALASRDVRWETVRKLLAELWSVRRSLVIDLLPTLITD